MNIGIVWQAAYPWDVRIDKFVRSLRRFGCSVVVIANAGGDVSEYLDARIERLSQKTAPLPFAQAWRKHVFQACEKYKLDVLIIRDLPLFAVGRAAARRYGVKLWFDMAEDYPATFLDMKRGLIQRVTTRNYHLARLYEKWAVAHSDAITVVVEESAERVMGLGVQQERVRVIGNPPYDDFAESTAMPPAEVIGKLAAARGVKFLYHGNLGTKRGLDDAVRAICQVEGVQLLIAGGKEHEVKQLLTLAASLGRPERVLSLGTVPYMALPEVIRACDVGIIPHRSTVHTETTIPNKLFDNMALGKPVLVSDVGPLKRIVEEAGAGLVFACDNLADLAKQIVELRDNAALRTELGRNGLEAFNRSHRWEHSEARMSELLQTLR